MTFDDEGHGIYKAGNREKLLIRIERFFAKASAVEGRHAIRQS